jgi:hypothetical protein
LESAMKVVPEGCMILPDCPIELSSGLYFCFQGKEFIRAGDVAGVIIGPNSFIVNKRSGLVSWLDSQYSKDENFRDYELGFRSEATDLIIEHVADWKAAIHPLMHLGLRHPSIDPDIESTKRERYSQAELTEAISSLPCAFSQQLVYFKRELLNEIEASGSLLYRVRPSNEAEQFGQANLHEPI